MDSYTQKDDPYLEKFIDAEAEHDDVPESAGSDESVGIRATFGAKRPYVPRSPSPAQSRSESSSRSRRPLVVDSDGDEVEPDVISYLSQWKMETHDMISLLRTEASRLAKLEAIKEGRSTRRGPYKRGRKGDE